MKTIMNTRTFVTLASFCLLMASCCKVELDSPYYYEEQAANESSSTRSDDERGYALVRLGMFENVPNHTVSISNLSIEASNSKVELPEFGSNINGTISDSFDAPTFDMANASYHSVLASGRNTDIVLHFDAVVTSEDGLCVIPIENVSYRIESSLTGWASDSSYSYIVCLDAAALGLSEIVFDPSVSDYENVTVTF